MEQDIGTITNVIINSSSRVGGTADDATYNVAWEHLLNQGRYKLSWKFIEATPYTAFQQLLNSKPPWGKYSASSWVQSTLTLTDETNRGRHGVGTEGIGSISQSSGSGNGATASIPFIAGNNNTSFIWPSGSYPPNHTIAVLSRYTGTIQNRIFTSNTDNYAIGHHLNKRGSLSSGGALNGFGDIPPTGDWLNLVYTNAVAGTNPTPNNILVNGVGTGTLNGAGSVSSSRLGINVFSGGEQSNFQFSQVIIWDVALTPAEMVIVSDAYANYLLRAVLDTPTPLQRLLDTKPAWARYSASSWVQATQTLTDETGNGRHGVGAGTMIRANASGNGASASIPYIQGVPSDVINFPIGSLAAAHTIFFIARYTGANNQQRILTSNTDNIIFGHHGNKRGVVFSGGAWRTNQTSIQPTTDWVNMGLTNGTVSNPIPNNILLNGVGVGISTGGSSTGLQLGINTYHITEASDFQLAHLLIWNVVLTPAEMVVVSDSYTRFLGTGIFS